MFWLLTLPFRLAFWVVFGVLCLPFLLARAVFKLTFGLLMLPFVLAFGALAFVVGSLVFGLAVLVPLIPLLLIGLGIAVLVKLAAGPTTAAGGF